MQDRAETEAAVKRAQTFTALLVAAGEGKAGHADIAFATLSSEHKARLAVWVDAWVAEERKRHDGRTLIYRIIAGETDRTGVLDPNNPDHRAAVDDYFENVVIPGRGRVRGAATFIAATGMVPQAAVTILAKALGGLGHIPINLETSYTSIG